MPFQLIPKSQYKKASIAEGQIDLTYSGLFMDPVREIFKHM